MAAVIGVWGIRHPHANGHLQALENVSAVDKALIYSEHTDRLQQVCAESEKAEPLDDHPDVLLDPDTVDALMVLLPTDEAFDVTLQAIERGIYVYGDKPGAPEAGDMQKIV